jgi:hypothetical protein
VFKITNSWLESNQTPAGGYNQAQCQSIGIPWPLKKGWKRRIAGKEITDEQAANFRKLRHANKPKNRRVYPRVGGCKAQPKNTIAVCWCGELANSKTTIECSYMRGDDDVVWTCDEHKNQLPLTTN